MDGARIEMMVYKWIKLRKQNLAAKKVDSRVSLPRFDDCLREYMES